MTDRNPKAEPASRNSWQSSPMPSQKNRLPFKRSFTWNEFQLISRGVIPVEMEDKWFVFLENNQLYIHRSWTGYCIYEIRLEHREESYAVIDAWVNRNFDQYDSDDDDYDVSLLNFLIDNLLLGRMTPFPMPEDLPERGYRHPLSGSSYPEVVSDEENRG